MIVVERLEKKLARGDDVVMVDTDDARALLALVRAAVALDAACNEGDANEAAIGLGVLRAALAAVVEGGA